jgi:Bpu10I restriction endonuclease
MHLWALGEDSRHLASASRRLSAIITVARLPPLHHYAMSETEEEADLEIQEAGPPTQEELETPHRAKLKELLANTKLPGGDKDRVEAALEKYEAWVHAMSALKSTGDTRVGELVSLLNDYKYYIEFELIFDSPNDFLYRQSGQLKVSSSVIEEFLPRLVTPDVLPQLKGIEYLAGPQTAFAAAIFMGTLAAPQRGAGLQLRTKDQDFTIGRTAYLRASFRENFPNDESITERVYLAYVAAECKTNLDKTMFQEAAATAHDLRIAVPGSHYFLLCEWLDMLPISTAGTDIDEAIILRGKRISSNVRKKYADAAGRKANREVYSKRLNENPVRLDRVMRFVNKLRDLLAVRDEPEAQVLERGYF